MDSLSAARAQMAVSLGFHMVFAASGIALPLLMLMADGLWLRTGRAPYRWGGLIGLRAAPVLVSGVAAALLSGWALLRRHFRLARAATVAQVSLLLLGWGLAQYPYLIYPDVSVHRAVAPHATLRFVVYSLPIGMALLLPSLWLLFRVFKADRPRIARESAPSPGEPPLPRRCDIRRPGANQMLQVAARRSPAQEPEPQGGYRSDLRPRSRGRWL